MGRKSFIIYRSFYGIIKMLPKNARLKMFEAIFDYGFDNIPPIFTDEASNSVWETIKPQLDANNARYINGCKGAQFGNLGGAPKGNHNARHNDADGEKITTPNTTPTPLFFNNPETTPNVNENENENDLYQSVCLKIPRDADEGARVRDADGQTDGREVKADVLSDEEQFFIESIEAHLPTTGEEVLGRFMRLIKNVPQTVKINGKPIERLEFLKNAFEIIRGTDNEIENRINALFGKVDANPAVKNKQAYELSAIWNAVNS